MSQLSDVVRTTFGGRLRVRVCGLCFSGDDLLLIRHHGLGEAGYLYAPPGGEVHFNERTEDALIREYQEETGLHIRVRDFLFLYEYRAAPLHALEIFFSVDVVGGELCAGLDPEIDRNSQLIRQVAFMSPSAIDQVPAGSLHGMLVRYRPAKVLLSQRGYFEFDEKRRN